MRNPVSAGQRLLVRWLQRGVRPAHGPDGRQRMAIRLKAAQQFLFRSDPATWLV